jgi:hypothetical protein
MRFTLYSITVLIAYTMLAWRGTNVLPTSTRSAIPASARSSPGGYRSYHSFHSFHGGK